MNKTCSIILLLDGKFILELARSKDGEKGGWVSVPRKIFRTPSAATSSTVTPSATASTSAAAIPSPLAASPAAVVGGGTTYPKNECSNSLSCKYLLYWNALKNNVYLLYLLFP